MIKKLLIPLTVVVAMVSTLLVGCTPKPIDPKTTVVAEVGSTKIMRSDLDLLFTPTLKELNAKYPNVTETEKKEILATEKKKLLDGMVDNIILASKATELKLFADDKEIETAIDNKVATLKTFYKTDDAFNKALEEKGMTVDILRKSLKQQIVYDKVYQYLIKNVNVTDEDISQYYAANPGLFTEQPNTMDVYHILVRTEAEAKDVKTKLDAGGDFATLAKQYSVDKETKDVGGYMGKLASDNVNYDRTFVTAVLSLNNNTISNPFKDSYGFEIVKVMNKTNIQPLPLEKVKDKIKNMLLYERKSKIYNDALKAWKQDIKITLYSENITK